MVPATLGIATHKLGITILEASHSSHYPKFPICTLARLVLDRDYCFFPSYWLINGKGNTGVAQQLQNPNSFQAPYGYPANSYKALLLRMSYPVVSLMPQYIIQFLSVGKDHVRILQFLNISEHFPSPPTSVHKGIGQYCNGVGQDTCHEVLRGKTQVFSGELFCIMGRKLIQTFLNSLKFLKNK